MNLYNQIKLNSVMKLGIFLTLFTPFNSHEQIIDTVIYDNIHDYRTEVIHFKYDRPFLYPEHELTLCPLSGTVYNNVFLGTNLQYSFKRKRLGVCAAYLGMVSDKLQANRPRSYSKMTFTTELCGYYDFFQLDVEQWNDYKAYVVTNKNKTGKRKFKGVRIASHNLGLAMGLKFFNFETNDLNFEYRPDPTIFIKYEAGDSKTSNLLLGLKYERAYSYKTIGDEGKTIRRYRRFKLQLQGLYTLGSTYNIYEKHVYVLGDDYTLLGSDVVHSRDVQRFGWLLKYDMMFKPSKGPGFNLGFNFGQAPYLRGFELNDWELQTRRINLLHRYFAEVHFGVLLSKFKRKI